ncbi:unnamed protein product [Ectocarpus sp. 6 AP-2014]
MDDTFIHASRVRELMEFEVTTMCCTNTHPNIARLVDVLASKSKIFAVTERAGGGDLFDAIVAEGRLEDENLVHHYFRQLLDAIEHCHSRGICHRDIKSENVLLDKEGVVKLAGFALAGLFDPSTGGHPANLLHATCGTPDYVAPEVIEGAGYDGRPADLWSVGVTLYTMLAGFLPFEADSIEETFARIRAADFEHPPEISMSAWSLLEALLEPNPRKRYTIADVRLHPWMDHQPSDRFTTSNTEKAFGSGEKSISPCSGSRSSSSSSRSSESTCGGGVEGADSCPKLILDIWKIDDDDRKRGRVGKGRDGRDTGVQMKAGLNSYSISGSGSEHDGSGLPNSSGRSDMNDSHSSYAATSCCEMETRYSSDESSAAANGYHDSSRPKSTSPSPPASASVLPSHDRYRFSDRRTDFYRRSSSPSLGLTDSLPPASSDSPPSSMPPAVAWRCTWADVMGKSGGRHEADRPRARASTLRGPRRRRDMHSFSRRRRIQDQCLHPAAFRSSFLSKGSTEEEGVWAGNEGTLSSSTEDVMKLHHSEVVNFAGGFETEVHHLAGRIEKAVIVGEHSITPKTERNTPGSAWSCADRNSTTDAPKQLRSYFSGNSFSPSRQLKSRSSPRRRQQQNATVIEKRAHTWSEGSPSIVSRQYQALSTSPRGGCTGDTSTRIAVVSPASQTPARLRSLDLGTWSAARDAALAGVETQHTDGMDMAASVSTSSRYNLSRSVSSSTISHSISRPTWRLAETRMSMRRLGATRLLLSLPESEPLSLAKAFQRSLEDQCGCVCRLLPNPNRVARARVKACRTMAPSPGGETLVGVVLSVMYPGATTPPTADGFGDSNCRDGNERGIVDDRGCGSNVDSGGSSRSETSRSRGQDCGPAANGPDERSTDVLIALNAGTIEAFDLLIEDLLSLTDGRWRANVLQ